MKSRIFISIRNDSAEYIGRSAEAVNQISIRRGQLS